MKTILLIIALFWIIPSSGHYQETNSKPTTIQITRNKMVCNSTILLNNKEWKKQFVKPLKLGVNVLDVVVSERQRVRIEVTNFK